MAGPLDPWEGNDPTVKFEAGWDPKANSWLVAAIDIITLQPVLEFWTTTLNDVESIYLAFITTGIGKAIKYPPDPKDPKIK